MIVDVIYILYVKVESNWSLIIISVRGYCILFEVKVLGNIVFIY